jgi:hypothetical protein
MHCSGLDIILTGKINKECDEAGVKTCFCSVRASIKCTIERHTIKNEFKSQLSEKPLKRSGNDG